MKKILIIKTHAIGDLLMSSCGIRETKQAYPRSEITVMTGKWSAPIIENNPHIDKTLIFDDRILFKKKIFALFSLIFKIRKEKFDIAFIYHPNPLIHLLFAYLTGIKERYGFRRTSSRFLTGYIIEQGDNNYYYPQNFVNLLQAANIAPPENYKLDIFPQEKHHQEVTSLFDNSQIVSSDRIVVIAPGGSHNSKEKVSARVWPWEKYCDLINLLHEYNPSLQIVLTGGPTDNQTAEQIIEKLSIPIHNFCGKTSLLGTAVLIEKSKLLICNDSSLLHVALAQDTAVSCIFGPTAIETRIPENKKEYSVQSTTSCSPCYRYGGFPGCNINIACMENISADIVFNKVKPLLK